jgi:hypothetical protein
VVSEEIKAIHRSLSPQAAELLDLAERHPERRSRLDLKTLGLPDRLVKWIGRFQSWPTFLAPPKLTELQLATLAVPQLLKTIPERIFDNDVHHIARFFGESEEVVRLLFEVPRGIASALVRCDFLHTAAGFKCIEPNVSARIGGWEHVFIAEKVLQQPWVQDLLARHGTSAWYRNPFRILFDHVAASAVAPALRRDGELNTAFLMSVEIWPALEQVLAGFYAAALAESTPRLTGKVVFIPRDLLREAGGHLFAGATRIDVMIDLEYPPDPLVVRSFRAGHVDLYNSPAANLLGDKRTLALLSENESSERFSVEERAAIRAYIPWTRIVRPGPADLAGERISLPELLSARREHLVLKHAYIHSGEAVHIGRETSHERWEELARRALQEGHWLVQERLESLPYWYQSGDQDMAPHEVVWGTFAVGDRYGGGFLRMARKGEAGVVNTALGASDGLILEVREPV